MSDIAKLIERLWAINCGSQGCQSTRDEAVDALKRLTARQDDRAELMVSLGKANLENVSLAAENDRLRAELETAKRGLTQLSQLGGGRSEGNLIAQETLARLDAPKPAAEKP